MFVAVLGFYLFISIYFCLFFVYLCSVSFYFFLLSFFVFFFRLPPRASGTVDRSYEGQPAQNRCYEGKPAQNPILDYLREPPARSIGATKGNLHKTGATKGNLHKILILGGAAFAIPRRATTLATPPLCLTGPLFDCSMRTLRSKLLLGKKEEEEQQQ